MAAQTSGPKVWSPKESELLEISLSSDRAYVVS